MPKNVVQGIENNFATTFNWDNFKNYWNPDTSYTELKDYSKSVIQTGATVYSGVKIVQSVAKAVGRVTSPTTTTYYNNTAESIEPTIKGVSKDTVKYSGKIIEKDLQQMYNKVSLGKGMSSGARQLPLDLREQLAMKQVLSDPLNGAKEITNITMKASKWNWKDGWVKMTNNVNGVEIHFTYNKNTGMFDDFKFKGKKGE